MAPRPELIAHRGASRERPENSLAAFLRARELGADGVELDVHLTADGHLVVHHDAAIAVAAERRPIGSLTLAQVRSFRIRNEPIPTLGDVIDAIGSRLRIYCELKGPRTAGPACAALLALGDTAAVHSFDHRMVGAARSEAPSVARGVLESSYHLDPGFPLRAVAARDLWQHEALVDRALVEAIHREGGRVIAWTVNDPRRAADLAAIGVDGICTDDVGGVTAALTH